MSAGCAESGLGFKGFRLQCVGIHGARDSGSGEGCNGCKWYKRYKVREVQDVR